MPKPPFRLEFIEIFKFKRAAVYFIYGLKYHQADGLKLIII